MKKIFFYILLIIIFVGYIDSGKNEAHSTSSVLDYNIEETVFKPVKVVGDVVYKDIITDDFKGYTRLAIDSTFNAARVLFVNVIDTTLENVLNLNAISKEEY